MEYRNPVYSHPAQATIDMEINHPTFGWLPFTASPNDDIEYGRELFATAVASGTVAPYTPPTPEQLREYFPELTSRQFWMGAAAAGVTKEAVLAKAEALTDPVERAMAIVEINESTSFSRLHPFVTQFSADFNLPPEQLDSLWTWAAGL